VGSVVVVMTTPVLTANVNVALAVLCGFIESVTVTVTVSVSAVAGVPERIPVIGSSLNCVPVFGEITADQIKGYVPPVSVNCWL
jgi:hypothetical protein